jgi:hypothetical protein
MDKEVMVALRRLADGGRTVVVVTHSVAQLQMCDYLLVLAKGGRIAYFGPPQQALDFFGTADWADVFTLLQTDKGAARMAQEYRSSEFYVKASAARPAVRPEGDRLSSARQQSVWSQLVTLSRRYLRVIASDKAYLRLLCIYPFVLGLIPLVIPTKYGLELGPNGEPNVAAGQVLLVLIIMGVFMGASNSIRELVKEREVYRRERAVGLSTTAYLGSKVLVLSAITALQAAVLTGIGLLTRFPDSGALFKNAAWLEMIVTVAALAVASAMFGLVLSALVDNADKTLPPLVVLVMANLVFTGGLLALADKVGLNQVSWLFPGRWGFAAAAATMDLNHVMGSDTEAGKAQGLVVDALWEHRGRAYVIDLAGLLVLGVVCLVVTALLLRRLDPQRPEPSTGDRAPVVVATGATAIGTSASIAGAIRASARVGGGIGAGVGAFGSGLAAAVGAPASVARADGAAESGAAASVATATGAAASVAAVVATAIVVGVAVHRAQSRSRCSSSATAPPRPSPVTRSGTGWRPNWRRTTSSTAAWRSTWTTCRSWSRWPRAP